jgi:hypothetical protein
VTLPSHIVAPHMQLQTRAGFSGRMQRVRSLEVTPLSPKSIFVPEYSRQAYWPRWLILACDLDLNGTLATESPTIHGDTDCYECQRGLCMVIYCTKQRKKCSADRRLLLAFDACKKARSTFLPTFSSLSRQTYNQNDYIWRL